MRATLFIASFAAVLVGCGSAASAPSAADPPSTSLTISFLVSGENTDSPKRWTLRCDPVGGTLPKRASACARLKALKAPFAPLRKDLQCTQIYGGPEEALITGTFRGKRVWTKLKLTDGCQIARSQRLSFLVPGFRAGSVNS